MIVKLAYSLMFQSISLTTIHLPLILLFWAYITALKLGCINNFDVLFHGMVHLVDIVFVLDSLGFVYRQTGDRLHYNCCIIMKSLTEY